MFTRIQKATTNLETFDAMESSHFAKGYINDHMVKMIIILANILRFGKKHPGFCLSKMPFQFALY